jgi:hypothetical protein
MAKTGLFAELVEDVRRGRRVDPERAADIVAAEYLEGMGPAERENIAFLGFTKEDDRNVRDMLEEHGIAVDTRVVSRGVCRHAVEHCGGHWTGFVLRVSEDEDHGAVNNVMVEGTPPQILDQAMEFLAVTGDRSKWCSAAAVEIVNYMAWEGYITSTEVTSEEASMLVEPWWDSTATFTLCLHLFDEIELQVNVPHLQRRPPGVEWLQPHRPPLLGHFHVHKGISLFQIPMEVLRRMLRPDRSAYARKAGAQ